MFRVVIPPKLLARIGDLQLAEVQYDTTVDMFSVYTHYLSILKEAAYIHGISSVASPGLAQFLADKVKEGVPVDLIVNEEVITILKQEPYSGNIRSLSGFSNFRIFITSEYLMPGSLSLIRIFPSGFLRKTATSMTAPPISSVQIPPRWRGARIFLSISRHVPPGLISIPGSDMIQRT